MEKNNVNLGAVTLILLVKNYRSDMLGLLFRNGVTVPQMASDEDIVLLMTNLLKVSKAYSNELRKYLSRQNVLETLSQQFSNFTEDKNFFNMSGYSNVGGLFSVDPTIGTTIFGTNTSSDTNTTNGTSTSNATSAPKGTWTSIYDVFNKGLNAYLTLDTNKTNRAIADANSTVAQYGNVKPLDTEEKNKEDQNKNSNTTIIVLVSLLGVAAIGAVVYFVMKNKK